MDNSVLGRPPWIDLAAKFKKSLDDETEVSEEQETPAKPREKLSNSPRKPISNRSSHSPIIYSLAFVALVWILVWILESILKFLGVLLGLS